MYDNVQPIPTVFEMICYRTLLLSLYVYIVYYVGCIVYMTGMGYVTEIKDSFTVLLQEKDLGVIVDSGLTFEEHVTHMVKKANQIVGLM